MQLTKPIAILGGTFDPIHNGHLAIARAVQEKLQPQEVRFIPCFQSPHRPPPLASAADRLAMVQLAIKNEKTFIADDREIKRGGSSYTIDTLKSLREEFSAAPLWLILSTDAFINFHRWHQYQDILNYAHLIVTQRLGYLLPDNIYELNTLLANHQITDAKLLPQKLAGYIYLMDFTGPAIAATDIREKLAYGFPAKEYLPNDVWHYIENKKLYNTQPYDT